MRSLGFRTRIVAASAAVSGADVLVALHAVKSEAYVTAFRKTFPNRPIVVVLTGTDVYGNRAYGRIATRALEAAGAIVALQPLAIERLPKRLKKKAMAIVQSAQRTRVRRRTPDGVTRLCVLGHLRREKDPLRAAYALRYLDDRNLEVVQAGRMLDDRYAARVAAIESRDARYRYLGEIPRSRAQRLLAGSDALVLSSRSEGGANVASEAIANGIPVLASRIDGNVGVFGRQYAGYYPIGSSEALAELVDRFVRDRNFARLLRRQILELQPLVRPKRERDALAGAIVRARGQRMALGEAPDLWHSGPK